MKKLSIKSVPDSLEHWFDNLSTRSQVLVVAYFLFGLQRFYRAVTGNPDKNHIVFRDFVNRKVQTAKRIVGDLKLMKDQLRRNVYYSSKPVTFYEIVQLAYE